MTIIIYLQILTMFEISGRTDIFPAMNMHSVSDVSRMEVPTAEPLVTGPGRLEDNAVAKFKIYKSPGSNKSGQN
jgi:hypothetical protein